jgi:hypothetical protein
VKEVMFMDEKMFIAIPIIIAAGIILAFAITAQNAQSPPTACSPGTLANAQNSAFSNAKLPASSSLPEGYELQAVDDAYHIVTLYYSDREICNPSQLVDELSNGTIVIEISAHPDLTDEEKIAVETSQNVEKESNGIVKPQVLEIAGHKAVAWDQYEGKNIVMTDDGKIINEEPMPTPARLTIFDAKGNKVYSMAAQKPLDVLLTMGKSIPLD